MTDYISNYTGDQINEAVRRALAYTQNDSTIIRLVSSELVPYDLNKLPSNGIYTVDYVTHIHPSLVGFKPVIIHTYTDSTKQYQMINMNNHLFIRSGLIPSGSGSVTWGEWSEERESYTVISEISDPSHPIDLKGIMSIPNDVGKTISVDYVANPYGIMNTVIPQLVTLLRRKKANGSFEYLLSVKCGDYVYETPYDGVSLLNWNLVYDPKIHQINTIDNITVDTDVNINHSGIYFIDNLKDIDIEMEGSNPFLVKASVDGEKKDVSTLCNGSIYSMVDTKEPKLFTGVSTDNGITSIMNLNGDNLILVYNEDNQSVVNNVTSITFSPDNRFFIVCGTFIGKCKLYSFNDSEAKYLCDIYKDNKATPFKYASCAAFSSDGTKFVIGSNHSKEGDYSHTYSFDGEIINHVITIDDKNSFNDDIPLTVEFMDHDRQLLISTDSMAYLFEIRYDSVVLIDKVIIASLHKMLLDNKSYRGNVGVYEKTPTYLQDIKSDNGGNVLSALTYTTTFTSDNKYFIIGGDFTGKCKLYSFNNGIPTYLQDIKDSGGDVLSNYVRSISFTSDNKYFIIGGSFTGRCKLYSFNDGVVTYLQDIKDSGGGVLSSYTDSISFTSDDKYFIIGGVFTGKCKLYSFNDGVVTYIQDIKDIGGGVLSNYVWSISFTSDNKHFIIGGAFTGFCKLYSFNDGIPTYLQDIKDSGGTVIDSTVLSISFTSDSKYFIIGGNFTGFCKLYSFINGVVTYIQDIKDSGGGVLTGYTDSISFTSDNKYFIIGGDFTGKCKLYSFNDGIPTYLQDIKDSGGNVLDGTTENSISFTSDNKYFIIGGDFTGYCKLYSFNEKLSELTGYTQTITFTSDNKHFIIGGGFTGYCKLYSFNNGIPTYLQDIKDSGGGVLTGSVNSISFTSDSKYFIIGGYFSGYCKLYSFNDGVVTYIQDIKDSGGNVLSSYVRSISFTSDGKYFIIGGYFTGYCKLYSFNDGVVTYIQDIKDSGGNVLDGTTVFSISFTSDDKYFIIGGDFTGRCKLYSFINGVVTYLQDIKDSSGSVLDASARSISFTSDGKYFIIGGWFTGYCKLYSFNNGVVTYIQDIKDSGGGVLTGSVNSISFTSDSKYFIIGGYFSGYCKLYSFNDGVVTYIQDIKDSGGNVLSSYVWSISFTSDNKHFIIGGYFTGYCKLYQPINIYGSSAIDQKSPSVQDIKDSSGSVLDASARSISFTSDNKHFIIGGGFTGKCKLYSFNDGVVTYIQDIKDSGGGMLSSSVRSISFTSDNKHFIIGGDFTGKCKLYSFNDGVVTYIQDIKDSGGGMLSSSVRSISFTSDNKHFIIGGDFTGKCKLYSFNDGVVTYIQDIKDSGGNVLSSSVWSISFTSDSKYFIIGGEFTGYCKLYSFNDGVVTYIQDIKDSGGNVLDGTTVFSISFTSDDKYFIIGGDFTGRCKLYSFINGIPTYLQDIKDSGGGVLSNTVRSISFTSDGKYFIIGGNFTGKCKLYSFINGVVTYLQDIKDSGGGVLSNYVNSISFTSDSKYFIIGGIFTGNCKLYTPYFLPQIAISESNKYVAYDNKVYKMTHNKINERIPLPITYNGNVSLSPVPSNTIPLFIKDNYIIFFDQMHGVMHYYKIVGSALVGIETITISSSDHYSNISVSNDNRFILISSPYDNERAILYKYNNGKITFVKELSPTTTYSVTGFLPVNCGDTYRSWIKTAGTRKK